MKNIFLDANILADYVLDRNLDETNIRKMFENENLYNFYLSALSVHICVYTLKIKRGTKMFDLFFNLIARLTVIPLNNTIVQKAFTTNYKDFEDLLQFYSAQEYCDTIFTRDIKDFNKIKQISKSKINILKKYE